MQKSLISIPDKGDIFGGLTAGIVALPLALAFGVQSGMGAAAGLYGAIFLGFFAASFGGTPVQISGPTGPMTVVSAATIASFVGGASGVEGVLHAIIATFILAGLFQILMGVLKLGSYIRYIPYPVVSGFMSGIGLIIILYQLFPALGLASPSSTIAVVTQLPGALSSINFTSLLYTALTIVIIYLLPKILKSVPSTLVALLAITILSLVLKIEIPIIGDIPQGFPKLHLHHLLAFDTKWTWTVIEAAITLAALGAIDSLLTSVVADNVTKTKHDSNKELIGQGIGNSIAGLFGGLPGAGATMRTLVNVRSGGKNRISGIIHSVILLIIVLGLGQYASLIPKSVLAGILITVGIGILDYKSLKHISKIPRTDAVIMVFVLLITVFFDLLIAVGVGILLSSLLFMKKMGDLMEENSKLVSLDNISQDFMRPDESIPAPLSTKIFVKHVDGPLFFGSATGFQNILQKMPETLYVIIRLEKVPYIDQTGLYALEDSIIMLEKRGIEVLFVGLQPQPRQRLEAIHLIPDLILEGQLFDRFDDCVSYILRLENPNSKK